MGKVMKIKHKKKRKGEGSNRRTIRRHPPDDPAPEAEDAVRDHRTIRQEAPDDPAHRTGAGTLRQPSGCSRLGRRTTGAWMLDNPTPEEEDAPHRYTGPSGRNVLDDPALEDPEHAFYDYARPSGPRHQTIRKKS